MLGRQLTNDEQAVIRGELFRSLGKGLKHVGQVFAFIVGREDDKITLELQVKFFQEVVIACGRGNNAGDGFVIARHLDLRGHAVCVLLWADPDELSGDAAANYRILEKTDAPIEVFANPHDPGRLARLLEGTAAGPPPAAWIVDALLGTGARGEPRPPLDTVIDQLNASPAARLAVDVPSGLDCDTGEPAGHTIRAAHTCTFVAPKIGLLAPAAVEFVGQLHVLDIGVPRQVLADLFAAE